MYPKKDTRHLLTDVSIQETIFSMLPHLRDLAWCALEAQKMSDQEVVVFGLEICDFWSDFANHLTTGSGRPGTSIVQNTGNERFISGLGDTGLYLLAKRLAPDLEARLDTPPEKGMARLLVFYAQGIVTMDIEPTYANAAC